MVTWFIFIFLIVWWMIFPMTLSIGIKVPKKQGRGHASSAPKKTYLPLKMLVTTILALLATWAIIHFGQEPLQSYLREGF